jgi:hypothetical protein
MQCKGRHCFPIPPRGAALGATPSLGTVSHAAQRVVFLRNSIRVCVRESSVGHIVGFHPSAAAMHGADAGAMVALLLTNVLQ